MRVLRQGGFDVLEASSGAQAIEMAERRRPEAMVLDVHLPDLDGFEVCRRIKENPVTSSMIVVQTSAIFRDGDDRIRGLDGGADAYVVQPVRPEELLATLRALFRLRQYEVERSLLLKREYDARTLAERAQRNVALLAEASKVVAGSLDYRKALVDLARLLVPALADGCAIDLLKPDGAIERLCLFVGDPQLERRAETLRAFGVPPSSPAVRVIRTGVGEMKSISADDANGLEPAHRAAYDALGPHSVMSVPMSTLTEKAVGAISLFMVDPERVHTTDEFVLLEDIGRRAGTAVEIATLFEGAQRAVRSRDDMLSIVSHDLRNPLSTILMSTVLMSRSLPEGEAGARLRKLLERVERPAKRMEALLGDLLDVSAIDSGRLPVEKTDGDLTALVRELREGFELHASKKSIALTIEATDALETDFDKKRMIQAISNVVLNAIKYTQPGGHVAVRLFRDAEGVKIEVGDDGPGISPEHLARIFERFFRERSGYNQEGLGLGLFITKGIVDAHGGRIDVESAVGRGSTFTIVLK
jgi:signal transduction histidine kinase/CheY-like chemotaxis protein